MSVSNPRLARNNLDLLRLFFATVVCLVHSYQLSGYQALSVITTVFSSAVAVKAFFVISGFLIFMSYEKSDSLSSYLEKRLRRIYPAYFLVVVLCALTFFLVSALTPSAYFLSAEWWRYLLANLGFMNFVQPSLPGVFQGHIESAVNGALWTIKVEVMFYLSVPVFVLLFRRFSTLPVLLVFYLASVAYALLMQHLAVVTGRGIFEELARQLPGQISYFMAGAGLYYFFPFFERNVRYFAAFAVLVFLVGIVHPLVLLEPLALAILVAVFGFFFYTGNFGRYGDFSYGVYILHFPVVQLLIHAGAFQERPWLFLLAVVVITGAGAVLLWNLCEKRFLKRSSHYVEAQKKEPAAGS
ncbi:MAG TPA: acyltransferase [Moraxellaceae bacterium]